jgi:hypothetical protein
MTTTTLLLSWVLLMGGLQCVIAQGVGNLDQFNYWKTDKSVNNNYGPEDWIKLRCDDIENCLGYPDSFVQGVEWELGENMWYVLVVVELDSLYDYLTLLCQHYSGQ